MEKLPDSGWLDNRVYARGFDMVGFGMMGYHGREPYVHTEELITRITMAIVGALYMDGGMEATMSVVGGYVDYRLGRDVEAHANRKQVY